MKRARPLVEFKATRDVGEMPLPLSALSQRKSKRTMANQSLLASINRSLKNSQETYRSSAASVPINKV